MQINIKKYSIEIPDMLEKIIYFCNRLTKTLVYLYFLVMNNNILDFFSAILPSSSSITFS